MKIFQRYLGSYIGILLVGLSLCVALVAVPSRALAASFLFSHKVIALPVGKTFSLPVVIDPGNEKQYTARFTIAFPSDKLEVTSFVFSSHWIVVPQPGYDVVDNKGGNLTKTAGFPKGFSSPQPFGTITFRAKHVGEALITVGSRSFILNANSQSTLQSRPQIRVVMTDTSTIVPTPTERFIVTSTESSMASEVERPMVSDVEPPELPVEEQNLFDVVSSPQQTSPSRPFWSFAALFAFGILLSITLIFLLMRYRRKKV